MAQQTEPESGTGTGPRINWEVVGAVLGAGAAIAGWIAVVGGARVWARLHAADIPATQTLAVLPRELLLVEGLQTLLVPLLIGGGAALLVHYSWPEEARIRDLEYEGREFVQEQRKAAEEKRRETEWEQLELFPLPKPTRIRDKRRKPAGEGEQQGPAEESGAEDEEPSRVPPEPGVRRAPPPGSPEDREQAKPKRRILAPLFLLLGLIEAHGGRIVAGMAVLCAVILGTLTLAIVQVNWWFPLVAILVGLALAVVGALVSPGWLRFALLLGAALVPFVILLVGVATLMEPGYIFAMAVVTLAAVWLTLGALVNPSRRAVALTLFAAMALWAGALGFLRLLGAHDPQLETAVVYRKNAPTLRGFYLGGSGGDVYIADESKPRAVRLIREDDVAELSFGEAVSVEAKDTVAEVEEKKTPDKGGGEPTPSPDPTLQDVVSVALGSLDGVPLRLEVMEPQFGKGLMVLNLRLTNRSTQDEDIPRPLVIGSLLDDEAAGERSDQRDTLDGLSVADLDRSRRHTVAHDTEGRCLCSRQLSRVSVEPGQSVRLYATFSPPPRRREFKLQVDGFGSIRVPQR